MQNVPIEGSDIQTIPAVNGVIRAAGLIKNPRQVISIKWEVTNPDGSGSTECEAWRGQYEIENLTRCGYTVLSVSLA